MGAGGLTMPTTIQEIYTQMIRALPPEERLRLATLILNDLVQQDVGVVDQRDMWTEQDQLDLVAFSFQSAATSYCDSDELAE